MTATTRLLVSLIAFILCACQPVPEPLEEKATIAEAVITQPAFGIAMDGQPTAVRLAEASQRTGIVPQMVVWFVAWPDRLDRFESPLPAIQAVTAAGAIPVITWEPWMFVDGVRDPLVIDADAIIDGKWNYYMDRFFAEVRDAQSPVWIRFAHEMNTTRYHWGIPDVKSFGPEAPFIYQRLFRHVVTRSREVGAFNIRWIFCANAESVPSTADEAVDWNRAERYYPGDAYVDIIGADGYNWGDSVQTPEWTSRWQSLGEVFTPILDTLRAHAPGKPFYIFETGSSSSGGDKDQWIRDAVAQAAEWNLAGWVWFDLNKETDWSLTSGTEAASIQAIRDSMPTEPPQH